MRQPQIPEGASNLHFYRQQQFSKEVETIRISPYGKQRSVVVVRRQGKIEATAHRAPHKFTSSVYSSLFIRIRHIFTTPFVWKKHGCHQKYESISL
jgi:hypothetical protein